MAIKPHNGFMDELGLASAVIRTVIVDRKLKDKSDPITMAELTGATLLSSKDVREEIGKLIDEGDIRLQAGELDQAGSFRVTGLVLILEADQKTLPLDKPVPPDTSSPTQRREETGKDDIELAGYRYYGTVEYDGEQGDPAFNLVMDIEQVETKEKKEGAFKGSYPTREEAWRNFDNVAQVDARGAEGKCEYIDTDGTIWFAELYEDEGLKLLDISRKRLGESVFTMFSEGQAFDTDTEAWDYWDEFCGKVQDDVSQTSTEEDLGVPDHPWDSEEAPALHGSFELKDVGEVAYEYWKDFSDGNDWIRFTSGEKVRTFSIASADWPRKPAMEKAIISFGEGLDWSEAEE